MVYSLLLFDLIICYLLATGR